MKSASYAKPRVCCILPPSLQADVFRRESITRLNVWNNHFSLEFVSSEKIPHGFQLYICPWFMVTDLIKDTIASRAAIIGFGPDKNLAHAFENGVQDYLREPWGVEEFQIRVMRLIEAQGYALSWGSVHVSMDIQAE